MLNWISSTSAAGACAPSTQSITVARHSLIYDVGLDIDKLLHCQQAVTLHNQLPASGALLADQRVVSVIDKGQSRGLLIETESKVRMADGGTSLFDLRDLYLARGDGGIGSAGDLNIPVHGLPARPPDLICETLSEPWQALLYRIAAGDRSGIHAEPGLARQAGFSRPILHGSCTLALACREVLASVFGYGISDTGSFGARFTAVMYPGERLETQIWVDGQAVSFRCRVPERDAIVLDNGYFNGSSI